MDIKKRNIPAISKVVSPNMKIATWLDKEVNFWGRKYPMAKIILPAGGAILFVTVLLAFAVIFGRSSESVDQKAALEREIQDLTSRLGRFMELPVGEQPTLATVTDRSKLQDQNFFSSALDGDKLLIYPEAKKAILFRPSTGKLVDAASLTAGRKKEKEEMSESMSSGGEETINFVD